MWFKSSYSAYNGDCVEVGMPGWVKSSHSGGTACVEVASRWVKASASAYNGACVETASCMCGEVLVRDSKDSGGGRLGFSRGAWMEFVSRVKSGDLGLG